MGDCGACGLPGRSSASDSTSPAHREKMEASREVSMRVLQHLRPFPASEKTKGYVGRRMGNAHCMAKNSQAGYHAPRYTWNQTDLMEDEGPRERLEGKQNTLPSRFVMEPWELFSFFSLGPECRRPQEDPVPWRHLLLGRNKASAQETGAFA